MTLLVVTWNSRAELPGLLASIDEQLGTGPELLVVDNASSDGSADLVEQLAPHARVLRLNENSGFAAANNIGVTEATGDVVVLLNPDTLLVDGSLEDLAAAARATGALCGARLLNEDGTPQISAHPPVAGWEILASALIPGRLMPRALRDRVEPWRGEGERTVGWISGACLAGTRAVLTALGPFELRLPLYGEDIDLGVRARQRGVAVRFLPQTARVIHLGNRSTVQRFDDLGIERKLRARDWLVRTRFGRARAAYDLAAQAVHFGLRRIAKPLAGRDPAYERIWLRAAGRLAQEKLRNAPTTKDA